MATHPANVDIIEEKLHWAFRMYDSDSSGIKCKIKNKN